MKAQSYTNHVRYYPLHHFIFYPVVLLGIGIGIIHYYKTGELVWLCVAALFGVISWLSFMLRQHYALTLQDRIALQEVKLRYYTLTQQRFEPYEQQLSLKQILALRFAPDEELPALTQQAIKDRLTPDRIKKSIKNWRADDMRV